MQLCPAPKGGTNISFADPCAATFPAGYNGAVQWLFGLQKPINGMAPANKLFGEKNRNVYPERGKLIGSQKQNTEFFIIGRGQRNIYPSFWEFNHTDYRPSPRSFPVFKFKHFYLFLIKPKHMIPHLRIVVLNIFLAAALDQRRQ